MFQTTGGIATIHDLARAYNEAGVAIERARRAVGSWREEYPTEADDVESLLSDIGDRLIQAVEPYIEGIEWALANPDAT